MINQYFSNLLSLKLKIFLHTNLDNVFNGLTKNTRVCVHPSVYDVLKYFTETVTPR